MARTYCAVCGRGLRGIVQPGTRDTGFCLIPRHDNPKTGQECEGSFRDDGTILGPKEATPSPTETTRRDDLDVARHQENEDISWGD